MNIAFIVPSLVNQGPIVVVKSLVDVLIDKGCQIDIYYFDDLKGAMAFKCPTYKISMDTPFNFDEYDVIHSHCLRPDRYVYKWRKKIKTAKLITTLHQDTFQSFYYQFNNKGLSRLLTWYWCRVQSHFDGVISISNQLTCSYLSKISVPITTIYNGCPESFPNTEIAIDIKAKLDEISSKYRVLGTYAFITKRKGLDQILQCLTRLKDYALIVIGEGPYVETLHTMSKELNLTDRVLFLPYQNNPRSFLKYFDIYVMPSYSEGFGLAVVEAALSKKAIVCSDIPSFHELFPSNEVSFFKLHNIENLSSAIEKAYYSREILGEKAYLRASNTFTEQVMAENHYKYYQELLSNK